MKIGKCKLCLQEKELLNKSHIIPNSFYKIFMDDDKSFVFTTNVEIKNKKDRPNKRFTGEFENGVLCVSCDNKILGSLDSYGINFFCKGFKSNYDLIKIYDVKNLGGYDYSIIKNIDYKKIKLFLLSVLWRASISKREFFKDVDLGPYENKIRKMILFDDPKLDKDFPIITYSTVDEKLDLNSLIGQPRKVKQYNSHVYVFVINGLIFIYYINDRFLPSELIEYSPSKENTFKIIHIPPHLSREYIFKFLNIF